MRCLRYATFKILALLEFGCSVQKYAIQTNAVNWDAKPTKPPLLLAACGPHLLHPCRDRFHSPLPNNSSIAACTSAQLCNKVLIGNNGMPQIHSQNYPFPSTITTPIQYNHPSTDPTHNPKRHPDPFSRFVTVHFPDRHTDIHRETDRWSRRQVSKNTAYACYTDKRATGY